MSSDLPYYDDPDSLDAELERERKKRELEKDLHSFDIRPGITEKPFNLSVSQRGELPVPKVDLESFPRHEIAPKVPLPPSTVEDTVRPHIEKAARAILGAVSDAPEAQGELKDIIDTASNYYANKLAGTKLDITHPVPTEQLAEESVRDILAGNPRFEKLLLGTNDPRGREFAAGVSRGVTELGTDPVGLSLMVGGIGGDSELLTKFFQGQMAHGLGENLGEGIKSYSETGFSPKLANIVGRGSLNAALLAGPELLKLRGEGERNVTPEPSATRRVSGELINDEPTSSIKEVMSPGEFHRLKQLQDKVFDNLASDAEIEEWNRLKNKTITSKTVPPKVQTFEANSSNKLLDKVFEKNLTANDEPIISGITSSDKSTSINSPDTNEIKTGYDLYKNILADVQDVIGQQTGATKAGVDAVSAKLGPELTGVENVGLRGRTTYGDYAFGGGEPSKISSNPDYIAFASHEKRLHIDPTDPHAIHDSEVRAWASRLVDNALHESEHLIEFSGRHGEDYGKGLQELRRIYYESHPALLEGMRSEEGFNRLRELYREALDRGKEDYTGVKDRYGNDYKVALGEAPTPGLGKEWADREGPNAILNFNPSVLDEEISKEKEKNPELLKIEKLNAFEDSQKRKYGENWKDQQTPEETSFHSKLLRGEVTNLTSTQAEVKTRLEERLKEKGITPEILNRVNELIKQEHYQSLDKAIRIAKAEAAEGLLESSNNASAKGIVASEAPPSKVPPSRESARLTSKIDTSNPKAVEDDLLATGLMTPEELAGKSLPVKLGMDRVTSEVPEISQQQLEQGKRNVGRPRKIQEEGTPKITDQQLSEGKPPGGQKPPSNKLPTGGEGEPPTPTEGESKSPRHPILKALDEITSIPTTMKTMFHFSYPLRQGMFFITRPEAWSGMSKGFHSFFSEKTHNAIMEELKSRPNADLYDQFGLQQTSYGKGLEARPEEFPSTLSQKIPLAKQSSRGFMDTGNLVRANMFDMFDKKLKLAGKDPSNNTDEYKYMTNYINDLTRRTPLPKALQGAGYWANKAMFTPRGYLAKWKILGRASSLGLDAPQGMKLDVLRDIYGGLALAGGLTASAYFLGKAAGEDVDISFDPRSKMFGKAKVGETTYDFFSGLLPIITDTARLITGQEVTKAGGEYNLEGFSGRKVLEKLGKPESSLPPTFNRASTSDVISSHFRNQAAPWLTATMNALKGENGIGQPYTFERFLSDVAEPLAITNVRKGGQDYGVGAAARNLPSIIGGHTEVDLTPEEEAERKEANKPIYSHKPSKGKHKIKHAF